MLQFEYVHICVDLSEESKAEVTVRAEDIGDTYWMIFSSDVFYKMATSDEILSQILSK